MPAAPRVLYVPNERGSDQGQVDLRRAFCDLESAGLVRHTVYSLLARVLTAKNSLVAERQRSDLVDLVSEFQPTHVLMQHLGGTGLKESHLTAMRRRANFTLIYHEADPYTRWKHPLPPEARAAGRNAEVVFTVGTGTFARNFIRAGATDVRWVPSIYSPGLFGRPPPDSLERPFDVVMIANKNTPRFRGLPNWRERIEFVEYMSKRFGKRFAIFGRGWSGLCARGPIPYARQEDAIRSGWISTNWDHFRAEPFYFSDRLPISMACGSIHAASDHPGYDTFFADTEDFLLRGSSFEELGDQIENTLASTTPERRLSLALKAQRFADQRLRQDDQLVEMLNASAVVIAPQFARASWRLPVS